MGAMKYTHNKTNIKRRIKSGYTKPNMGLMRPAHFAPSAASRFIRKSTARVNEQLRIAAIAFETQEGMLITDANNVILRVNKAFTETTGYTPEEVIGKNPRLLQSGRHDQTFYAAMWNSINDTGTWEGEIWNRRKKGEIYPEYLTITAVKNPNGASSPITLPHSPTLPESRGCGRNRASGVL